MREKTSKYCIIMQGILRDKESITKLKDEEKKIFFFTKQVLEFVMKAIMRTPAIYRGIEMVLQATVIGAIKIGVDSIAQSIIPKHALHNSKIRKLKDSTANDDMLLQ